MISGVHYEDEQLLELLAVDSESDPHLSSCTSCRERLASLRTVTSALRDSSVWDQRPLNDAPIPATIANLRAFADRMTAEDTQADLVLRQLLAGPRESWTSALEHRTAGMVRKLIEASERAIDTMPPDAVYLATLATDLAATLPAEAYPSDTVPRLRGAAWRERAYALFYTGAFADAEQAIFASESHLSDCLVDEYEKARLGIVRALVDRATERFAAALQSGAESTRVFARYADIERYCSARVAEAHGLFSRGEFNRALSILTDAEDALVSSSHVATHATVVACKAYCLWKLGRIEEALPYYEAAASLYDDLSVRTESVRIRWSVAALLASQGRISEARLRLEEVSKTFAELGMTCESALADLDLAELMLGDERFTEVEEICRRSIRTFEQAGVAYTAKALTALAFIREASSRRAATPLLLRHVREYIRRLPEDANLLFAPPPG